MSSYVSHGTMPDGAESYVFEDFYLTFYDDHMHWDKRVLHREKAIIHYSDISSVSYSNGGLFAKAYLSVGTTGRSYYVQAIDSYYNMQDIANAIEKRRVEAAKRKNQSQGKYSVADEIAKLNALMNQGVITRSEFEAKKKKLLDL